MMHKLNPIRSPFNKDVEAILMNYPKGPNGYTLKLFRVFANSLRFLAGKGVVNLLDEGFVDWSSLFHSGQMRL